MFSVGMKLTIESFKDGEVEDRFQCKLVEYSSKKLFVDYPVNERTGRTALFLEGTELRVSFVGKAGSVYSFPAEILMRKKINQIPTLVFSYPLKENLKKIQRREYVRIDTSLDVAIYSVDENKQPLITRTIDISGGGIAVVSKERKDINFVSGDKIEITMVLPFQTNDYSYLTISGEIIRHVEQHKDQPPKLTIKFLDLDDDIRERIIKYCFDKQLERRRKLHS
ncbi:flagellar brake protein [Halalkalibacillus sediminis]|nr:flagellar brake domain-containing protein [Halalkalibacillus sediminis]